MPVRKNGHFFVDISKTKLFFNINKDFIPHFVKSSSQYQYNGFAV